MNVPEGYTEEQVTSIIVMVGNRLASKFQFGNYTPEDIKQEVAVAILLPDGKGRSALDKYNPATGPLENYLFVHSRNRLSNLKRDKFQRLNKPCYKCPLKAYLPDNDECIAYCDKSECALWAAWSAKNSAKKNVLQPVALQNTNDEDEDGMKIMSEPINEAESEETFRLIDSKLPSQYRHDYCKLIAGLKLPRARKLKIREVVSKILEGEDGESE